MTSALQQPSLPKGVQVLKASTIIYLKEMKPLTLRGEKTRENNPFSLTPCMPSGADEHKERRERKCMEKA